MANYLLDSTYYIEDTATVALTWPSGMRVNQIRVWALSTAANLLFIRGAASAATPTFRFTFIGSQSTAMPASYVFPMNGQMFPTAWIPSIVTAVTAWIDFA